MGWILLAVLVILVLTIGFALYTTQGSGISKHPQPDGKPPADSDPEYEGIERPGAESSELDQRGTDGG